MAKPILKLSGPFLVAPHFSFSDLAPIFNSKGNPVSMGAKYMRWVGIFFCKFRLKSLTVSETVQDIAPFPRQSAIITSFDGKDHASIDTSFLR